MVYSDNKGIRDEMVTKYGLDNSKIGWDGKNVTYDNKYFMTPSTVSDGKSYAPQTEINRAVSKYFSNGDFGVRTELENRGVDTSKLGFDNGIITYNGKNLMKPDRVENGVSYVSNPETLTAAAIEAHKANGKNIVKFSDYTAGQNLPFNIGYNNDMVSINGQNIKPEFIENGVAYVDSAELDKVIETAKKSMGIQDPNAMYEQYKTDITPLHEQYIDMTQNREPFEYDYASDPVYQAYKEMYTREGDRVMRDVMGEYAANTGGYVNSAGITAGAQANNYYMQQLADKIPQLFESAYGRYNTDYINKLNALENIIGHKQNMFNTEYGVNSDIMNNIYANNALKQQREDNISNRSLEEKYHNEEKAYKDLEIQKADETEKYQKIMTGGQMKGYFSDDENAWLANYFGDPIDTKYTPFGADINAAAVQHEIDMKYATPKTYSSGGGSSGKTGDGYDTNTKKGITQTVDTINTYLKSQFPYTEQLLGENGGEVLIANPNGTVDWNPQVLYTGNEKAFDEIILQLLSNSSGISDTAKEDILISLGIDLSNSKFDGMY